MMSAFSSPFSSEILISALFQREIAIRADMSMVNSEPAMTRRMTDGCEMSTGARCRKAATMMITVRAT